MIVPAVVYGLLVYTGNNHVHKFSKLATFNKNSLINVADGDWWYHVTVKKWLVTTMLGTECVDDNHEIMVMVLTILVVNIYYFFTLESGTNIPKAIQNVRQIAARKKTFLKFRSSMVLKLNISDWYLWWNYCMILEYFSEFFENGTPNYTWVYSSNHDLSGIIILKLILNICYVIYYRNRKISGRNDILCLIKGYL